MAKRKGIITLCGLTDIFKKISINTVKRTVVFITLFLLILSFSALLFGQSNEEVEAWRLYDLGTKAYMHDDRLKEALNYFEKSLKINRTINNNEGIAANLLYIGRVYKILGHHEVALRYFEEALALYEKLDKPRHIATTLNDIGKLFSTKKSYDKALIYHFNALRMWTKLNKPKEISSTLHDIGNIFYKIGRYNMALSYFEESLVLDRKLGDPEGIASNLNNIGTVFDTIGLYHEALRFYQNALKIYKKFNIHKEIATCLSNLGVVYLNLAHYHDALSYEWEALKIWKKLNIPQNIVIGLNNIGAIYDSMGQYDEALNCYEEALNIAKSHNLSLESIAIILTNIGRVYKYLGDYDEAEKYYRRAMKIAEKLWLPQYVGGILQNIGMLYLARKDYVNSEKCFKEAEKFLTEMGFRGPGLIEVYIRTGKYDKALAILNKMKPDWFADPHYRVQYHTLYGSVLSRLGDFKKASKELLSAVKLVEGMRARIIGKKMGFLQAGDIGGRIRPYKALVSTLCERFLKAGNQNVITKVINKMMKEPFLAYGKDLSFAAFYFSESTKARTLIEAIANSAKRYEPPEIPPALRERESFLKAQLAKLDETKEEAYKNGKEAFEEWQKRYKKAKAEMDELIKKLRKECPRYAALMYPKPLRVEELPLRDNEVLLEYELTEKAGYLFVVERGKLKRIVKIPKGKEEIEGMVSEFLQPFNRESPCSNVIPMKDFPSRYERSLVEKGKNLYELLLAPALKGITPDKNIIIVPDDILGLLPFEALVIKKGKSYRDSLYVGDKWTITYAQSATALALNRILKPSQAKKPLFALGNPIYNKDDERYINYKQGKQQLTQLAQNLNRSAFRVLATRREWGKTTEDDTECEITFPPLPETEKEVKEIAKFFGVKPEPPDILLNIYANETYLRQVPLKDYRYLHFATHADLPGKVQGIKEPFLLLGQVENKGKDDGFLTMTEVLELNLDADMVVLSACLTGRGKVMEGEGVLNFIRTFHHAGARSVVVSLWEVASDEAVEYMKTFYGYLKAGKRRAEALRLARKEIKAKYPNPFYWAVFILHGEG